MIQYGVVKGFGGQWCPGAPQKSMPGGQTGPPGRCRVGPSPAARGALSRFDHRRHHQSSMEQRCCVPSGCSHYAGEPIDPQDPGDAVKVVCSSPGCVAGSWMHIDCYEDWHQKVLFYIRCCELGRGLVSDRQLAIQCGLHSLGGYEAACRACACVCGKGILRRDLRHSSPVNYEMLKVGDVSPVAAALLYYPTPQQQQQQQRMRTCSFSSTGSGGSGSTGSATTPPLSPPRPAVFFPPSAKPGLEHPGSGTGTPSGSIPSPPPVKGLGDHQPAIPQPARGNIFEHRSGLEVFRGIRRSAQNAYHIRLDDDGPHGNDEVRRMLMRRLSAAGVRRFCCVACRRSMPVYDEFPLVDGTFFLSPRHYGGGESTPSPSGGADAASTTSQLAVPVVHNRRMMYLHAVCLACLGAVSQGDPHRVRSADADCVTRRNKILCRFCGDRWTTGECLVLGTMYTYDVLACTPCCAARRACRRCGGPPEIPALPRGGSSTSVSQVADAPANFSDCSKLARCSWCSLEDYHFVKTFDEAFVCARAPK